MPAAPEQLIEWTAEYAVNVAQIDQEHKHWFGTVNRLHEAMLDGQGKDVLGKVLAEVTEYTFYHFAHEEELMTAIGYPESLTHSHVQQHNELRQKATAMGERFERGARTITIETMLFLSEWLKQHITSSDRRIGEYLSARTNAATGARRFVAD